MTAAKRRTTAQLDHARQVPTAKAPPAVHVYVLEGTPVVRIGLHAVLGRRDSIILKSDATAPPQVPPDGRLRSDVLLLDTALDRDGRYTRHLIKNNRGLRVVLFVRDDHMTQRFLAAARHWGARSAIPRSIEPKELVTIIRNASRGIATWPAPPAHLSRREREVLALVAEGLENKAIGAHLWVSTETVRSHIKSILRKLGAHDRTHAVTIARRAGIPLDNHREE